MHPKIKELHDLVPTARKNDKRFVIDDESYLEVAQADPYSPDEVISKAEIETVLRFVNQTPATGTIVLDAWWVVRNMSHNRLSLSQETKGLLRFPLAVLVEHQFYSARIICGTDTVEIAETDVHYACNKYRTVKAHKFLATHTELSEVEIRDVCNVLKGKEICYAP